MNKKLIVLISVLTIAGSVQAMEKGWAFHDYLERKKANDKEYLNLPKENKINSYFQLLPPELINMMKPYAHEENDIDVLGQIKDSLCDMNPMNPGNRQLFSDSVSIPFTIAVASNLVNIDYLRFGFSKIIIKPKAILMHTIIIYLTAIL